MGTTKILRDRREENILVLRVSQTNSTTNKQTEDQDKKNKMDMVPVKYDSTKNTNLDIHTE